MQLSLIAALMGCTQTLPAPEAGAFKTIATLSRDDFAQRVQDEYDTQVAAAARELRANRGRIVVNGCGSSDEGDCILTYTDDTLSVPLISAAPKARLLIGSIANYGDRMADLAEAKDLDELKTKAAAAGGAAKALALAALPAGPLAGFAAPLVDVALWAANASRVDRRRRALLEIALATQPAIDQAVATLTAMRQPLQDTVVSSTAARFNEIKNAITLSQVKERRLRASAAKSPGSAASARALQQADQLRDRRSADFETLMKLQAELNAARAPGVDYAKLSSAHRALIDKLSDPNVSIENALRDLDFLVATAGAARTAIRSTAPAN